MLISATTPEKACINTESLIGFVSEETTTALEEADIQVTTPSKRLMP